MTVAEVVGQIGEIRSRLALMVPQRVSADAGASFATALSAASGTAATGGVTATGTGATGSDVVAAARQYVGVPYVLGGESKSGIDCSGLVQAAFEDLGVDVPRLVHEQQTVGQEVGSLKDAQPGDLIVLDGGDHIAIWAGDGKAIHAPYPGRTVSEQAAWFDDADVVTIRRVVPADTEAAASGTAVASSAAASSGTSAAALAQATAMLGMYSTSGSGSSTSSAADSLSAMLGTVGTTGSSSTAQQLLAARSQLLGSAS